MKGQKSQWKYDKHLGCMRLWKVVNDRTTQWSSALSFWRISLKMFVYRHRGYVLPDRWVFQWQITYDRKYLPQQPQ